MSGTWTAERGDVCYLPRPGEDMTKAEVIAPRLTQLLLLDGEPGTDRAVSNLVFCGLTFAHADWTLAQTGYTDMQAAFDIPGAVEANGVREIVIERCRFAKLGTYAISFGRGCIGNTIDHDGITDVGAGGVKIGEPKRREAVLHMEGTRRRAGTPSPTTTSMTTQSCIRRQ